MRIPIFDDHNVQTPTEMQMVLYESKTIRALTKPFSCKADTTLSKVRWYQFEKKSLSGKLINLNIIYNWTLSIFSEFVVTNVRLIYGKPLQVAVHVPEPEDA